MNWWDHADVWIQAGYDEAVSELKRLLSKLSVSITAASARTTMDRAIEEARTERRREIPWYFDSQDRLRRWLTIVAYRAEIGLPIPTRVLIPMLDQLDDPFRSFLLYYRHDGFRPQHDLPYVFNIPWKEVLRLLREAERRWDDLFGKS